MFMSSWSASTDIYTLSLHDALPICGIRRPSGPRLEGSDTPRRLVHAADLPRGGMIALHPRRPRRPGHRLELTLMRILVSNRSEEHTSELQSRPHLVCRLLLEKKNKV